MRIRLARSRPPPQQVLGLGTTLHGDAGSERDEVEPRRADRRMRPVDEVDALACEEDVVRTEIEMKQRVARDGVGNGAFELDQLVEMPLRPPIELGWSVGSEHAPRVDLLLEYRTCRAGVDG